MWRGGEARLALRYTPLVSACTVSTRVLPYNLWNSAEPAFRCRSRCVAMRRIRSASAVPAPLMALTRDAATSLGTSVTRCARARPL